MIFRFADPEISFLLLLIPVLILGLSYLVIPRAKLRYTQTETLELVSGSKSSRSVLLPRTLRMLALFFLVAAAARPQKGQNQDVLKSQGIDIIVALDISGSMRALDFQPSNRLEVAKEVIRDFISKRISDRIGLVLFGTDSFTLCPLTLDHELLADFLKEARIGMVEENTAIGKAIATSVNRLRISDHPEKLKKQDLSESQIVILCTDGVNTVKSKIDPLTAAKAAAALGIKIYTIGVGTNGYVDFPHPNFPGRTVKAPVELDEQMLKDIASTTGGEYFPARNSESLKKIFEMIDRIEKIEIESLRYTRYSELFYYPLCMAIIMLFLEIISRHFIFRRIF